MVSKPLILDQPANRLAEPAAYGIDHDPVDWTHSRFADGRRIHPAMFRYLRRHIERADPRTTEPCRVASCYFDEPEPGLAIFGPPAITRLMFELWRGSQQLQARFDLGSPLGRRNYGRWAAEEGRWAGLDDASIAAAVAILRQGTSLEHDPPRWRSQAAQAMPHFRQRVAAWLAEPIEWDLGAEPERIPMPRVLALLWELRQDVRMHFRNRSPVDVLNYLGWCLTQGIQDRCVPVELTEPALAGFFDMPDPELEGQGAAGDLPVTRLLQVLAPLYDGPYPDIAGEFPRTAQGRLCVALWACGTLRRRFGWPKSFAQRPLRWLYSIAPSAADAFLPLDNLALGLWSLRPDLQARCDLRSHEGRAALLAWSCGQGRKDFELDRDRLSDTLVGRLRRTSPEPPRKTTGEPAIKRNLCLTGYARLVSGRAEDLRMSALALRNSRPAVGSSRSPFGSDHHGRWGNRRPVRRAAAGKPRPPECRHRIL